MLHGKFILMASLALLAVSCSDNDTTVDDNDRSHPSTNDTKVIAHRGYWNAPETKGAQNSIASLKAAQDFGAYGAEFDVNMTADDKLVVLHGPSHKGISNVQTADFEQVRAKTLENGEPTPTLAEYLEQGAKNKGTKLILEIKNHATDARETQVVEAVIDEVESAGMKEQVEYIAFSLHVCKEIVRLDPEAKVAYLNGDLSPAELKELGITGLDYQKAKMTANPSWLRDARALGITVNVWTINNADDMQWAVNKGVDYITTDYPDQVQAVIDAKNAAIEK